MVGYLTRVQKSVIEGSLAEDRLEPLRRMLLEEIDPVTDTVRIYHLCGKCIPATEVLGTGTYLEVDESDEVI
jgi:CRISPR-associated endonuclease Cas2